MKNFINKQRNLRVFTGSSEDDFLHGNGGDDKLYGYDGNDILDGGAGDDVLDGGAGADLVSYITTLKGVRINLNITNKQNTLGSGWDSLRNIEYIQGSNFDDELIGNTQANFLWGKNGNDKLDGGIGNDDLDGGAGNDVLNGGAGDDWFWGGLGNDVLNGGAGYDTSNYEGANKGLKIDLTIKGKQNTLGAGFDILRNIERIAGSKFNDELIGNAAANILWGADGDDKLDGGAGADELYGDAGNDVLDGSTGDDWFWGGSGNDVLDGGAGNDVANYEYATREVQIDLTITRKQNTLGSGWDTLRNIEHVSGSNFDDVLIGNAAANHIWGKFGDDDLNGNAGDDNLNGEAGNDVLDGSVGNDVLYGSDGSDILIGGAGNDKLDGGDGLDVASYNDATKSVRINLNLTKQNTFGAGIDTFINIEGVSGSKFKDKLIGNTDDNYFWGNAGDDKLNGGAGNDTYFFGIGDGKDKINDAAGIKDQLSFIDLRLQDVSFKVVNRTDLQIKLKSNSDGVIIKNGAKSKAGIGIETFKFSDQTIIKQDILAITKLDQTNNSSKNLIKGSAGNDVLVGSAGKDIFQLDNLSGVDTIKDFNVRADSMQLNNFVFTSVGQSGKLMAANFKIGNAAQDANDNIIYNKNTGELFYDADGKGGVEAVEIAILGAGLALTHADFLII